MTLVWYSLHNKNSSSGLPWFSCLFDDKLSLRRATLLRRSYLHSKRCPLFFLRSLPECILHLISERKKQKQKITTSSIYQKNYKLSYIILFITFSSSLKMALSFARFFMSSYRNWAPGTGISDSLEYEAAMFCRLRSLCSTSAFSYTFLSTFSVKLKKLGRTAPQIMFKQLITLFFCANGLIILLSLVLYRFLMRSFVVYSSTR